jgi:hypothetical protein
MSLDNLWHNCSADQLLKLAQQDCQLRRRTFLLRLSAAAIAASFVSMTGGWFLYDRVLAEQGKLLGGITCRRVRQLASGFVAGTLDNILKEKVIHHLRECSSCRASIETIRLEMSTPELSELGKDENKTGVNHPPAGPRQFKGRTPIRQ